MTEDTKEKKYRYTKQLVRLAIENGYTNQDIAVKAGLSPKSLAAVSRWRNGKALATERQLQYFINELGHLLKRKMEHLFYCETEQAFEFTYHKIEGEILLTHTLYYRSKDRKGFRKTGLYRFIIIRNGEKFHLLKQKKNGLNNNGLNVSDIWSKQSLSNEQANWHLTDTHKNLSPKELVERIDSIVNKYCHSKEHIDLLVYEDALPLKFIVRQILLKHGYSSDDIVDL